jgi:hypothetical protein
MTQVSRPMQLLLLVTVLVAGVWFVALRPKASGGDAGTAPAPHASAPGVRGLTTAIAKAHGAVATANGDAARAAGSSADGATQTGGASAGIAGAAGASSTAAHRHHGARVAHRHHAASAAHRHHAASAAHRHHAASSAHRHHAAVRARRAARSAHAHRVARARARHRVHLVDAALRHHRAIAIAFVDPSAADSRAVAQELAHVSSFHGRALVLSAPISQLSSFDAVTHDVQVTVAPTVVIVAPNGKATTVVGFADRVELQQRLADALTQRRKRGG